MFFKRVAQEFHS